MINIGFHNDLIVLKSNAAPVVYCWMLTLTYRHSLFRIDLIYHKYLHAFIKINSSNMQHLTPITCSGILKGIGNAQIKK